jgi:hypothetical protein
MTRDDENGQKNHGAKHDERDEFAAPVGLFPRMTRDHGVRCRSARALRPSGHLFVHEEHPAAPLWTWWDRRLPNAYALLARLPDSG